MRPQRTDIALPDFPPSVEWIGVPFVRAGTLLGRNAVLVWFWDCCSLNSLRALPYLSGWHRRYGGLGLRVLGVHSPQFGFGRDPQVLRAALERFEIAFPVAHDRDYEIWRLYGAEVWPSLYLWDRTGVLRWYHFAEGAYDQTEAAIAGLLREIDADLTLPAPMAPLRATDRPAALVRPPTPHRYLEEDRSGRAVETGDVLELDYAGAGAFAVLDGSGHVDVSVDGERVALLKLDGPGLYELHESARHERHTLKLEFLAPARAYMFSFAPGPA